ncbi:MAG: FAD:protein FMN transferase [Flavobacteriaceae bacterium]|nr:FAD:protein FMN transferase [Flavobacteriaceae bacterium]
MGSRFDVSVVAKDSVEGSGFINLAVAEIQRIEVMISSWNPNSQTSNIDKNAGIRPVKVSTELYTLIGRCIEVSKLTDGAFDISYASMDRI